MDDEISTAKDDDIAAIAELHILRHEIQTLRERLDAEEASDHRRLLALEIEVSEFRRKFAIGKGVFYGLVAGLGTGGVFVVDHLKELADKLIK